MRRRGPLRQSQKPAPQLMESVTSAASSEVACSGCLKPSNKLTPSASDQLCEKCKAVFLTAAVLLNEGVTAEDVLIPTLVFAKIAGGSAAYATLVQEKTPAAGLNVVKLMYEAQDLSSIYTAEEEYAGWELVRVIRGVPIFRVQPLAALPQVHPDTEILKSIRVQVLSRYVKPSEVGEYYERLLTERGVRWKFNNSGYISYRFHYGFLQIEAGLEGKISALTAESVGHVLYSWPAYNFPPPRLVAEIYESLLGKVHERTGGGFAYDLDLYGKPQAERSAKKIILAFAAWHVGERHPARIPPKSRPRVAGVLNRQLLDPSEHLPEDGWNAGDKVWRDVEELAMRFVRLYAGALGPSLPGVSTNSRLYKPITQV